MIYNLTKIKHAITFRQKWLGLMLYPAKKVDYCLVFHNDKMKLDIHTYLMRFNIDILWLDKNNIVQEIVKNVPPRKVVRQKSIDAAYVIEAVAGKFNLIVPGDRVVFQGT
jgi:uncharacterized membrane protein (UPF0127 family)